MATIVNIDCALEGELDLYPSHPGKEIFKSGCCVSEANLHSDLIELATFITPVNSH